MQYPKDVLVWEFVPGSRLAEFIIMLKNTKGALAGCATAIAQYNINLLSGFHTAPSSSSVGVWSFFADVTDSGVAPEQIAREVRGLPFVESVDVFRSHSGFLVDSRHFPVRWAGRRVIMFRTEAANGMISRLWDIFGTGAATILDEMAETMGRITAQEIVSDFGPEFAVENLEHFLKAYTALGIAEVEVRDYDRKSGYLRLEARGLFECMGKLLDKTKQKSVFFKGHLRGFMSAIFKAQVAVVEEECVTLGADHCSFEVRCREEARPNVLNQLDAKVS